MTIAGTWLEFERQGTNAETGRHLLREDGSYEYSTPYEVVSCNPLDILKKISKMVFTPSMTWRMASEGGRVVLHIGDAVKAVTQSSNNEIKFADGSIWKRVP